jgi:hypothetical protein
MGGSRVSSSRARTYLRWPPSDEQRTQPRRPLLLLVSPSASMDAVVSLKSDQSPSALNPTTISAADSSAPPAVLRVGQASTDEVHH